MKIYQYVMVEKSALSGSTMYVWKIELNSEEVENIKLTDMLPTYSYKRITDGFQD